MAGDPAKSQDVRIRKAMSGDAPAIAGIYVDTWRTTYAGVLPDGMLLRMSVRAQERSWRSAIAGRDRVLVAERSRTARPTSMARQSTDENGDRREGGRDVVGFGSAGPCRDAALGHAGEVYTLYVRPDHQDAGIGRRLLSGLFTALGEDGCDSALLWVLAVNPSRFFYERMGGVRIAERHERLWGKVLREFAYGWSTLEPPPGGRW